MRIKNLIITSTILASLATYAQKEELKNLKKIYLKEDITAQDLDIYRTNITRLNAVANDESEVVYAKFFKSVIPELEITALGKGATPAQINDVLTPKVVVLLAEGLGETVDYEKKSGKKLLMDNIVKDIAKFKPILVNQAIAMGDSKKYKESSLLLYSIYQMDKTDTEKLYYAANYAVNAQEYDSALKYYEELKKVKYSGEKTNFYAHNKANGQEEFFNTKIDRDNFVKIGTHEKPRDEKITSKRGEIYKNIALILVQKNKTAEAVRAVSEARIENPDDMSLVLSEADLYYKLGDIETYKILINRALDKNPNDPDLLFNLGVVSGNAKQVEEAEKYYRKAISLKPDYVNAYINLSEVLLRADDKIFKEMNKLGTSEKDNKRYEILNADRKKIFNSVVPLLEKALEFEPNNEAAGRTLISMYKALDQSDKAKALKTKMGF